MTLKQYITTMVIATIMCLTALGFVVVNVDPFISGTVAFFFFYVSFYFSLVGFLSVVLFFVYKSVSSIAQPMFRYVQKSFKQAIFISVFITLALYLQGRQWLNIWNATLLLLLFILYISFSLSMRKSNTPITHADI